MNILVLFIQILLVIPLFCILEYFNKKNINIIEKVLIPVCYILIVSGICPELKNNIYFIVIFEVILHEFYNNYFKEIVTYNKKDYFIEIILSILLSLIVYYYYINKVKYVLPNPQEFRPFIFFLIIIFIYTLIKNNIEFKKKEKESNFIDKKREYVIVEYAKLKNKYYKIVKTSNKDIERLIYSIMIYENYKNPLVIRKIKLIINRFSNRNKNKYGIMQVESSKELTDEESIKAVLKDISKEKEKNIVNIISNRYEDPFYKKDILDIYIELKEFEKK